MAKVRWVVQESTGGPFAERDLRFAVYDTEERDNRYAAWAYEKSVADKIARMLNTEEDAT